MQDHDIKIGDLVQWLGATDLLNEENVDDVGIVMEFRQVSNAVYVYEFLTSRFTEWGRDYIKKYE